MSPSAPIVSVVLPYFNSGQFLGAAIESILGQTFTEFELLLINDGSTDGSREIAAGYNDKRIVMIDNPGNKGLIYSLNTGLEQAKGKYIVRMDADDLSMPERIKKQVAFMEATPGIGAAGCSYYSFSERSVKKVYAIEEPEVLRTLLLFNSCLCHPAAIIRKAVLDEHHIRYNPAYPHAEDYDLWIQISKVSKLGNVKDFLIKYRRHEKQVTALQKKGVKETAQAIRKKYLEFLGFTFSEKDMETHYTLATNQLISDKSFLDEAENWLIGLIAQNHLVRSIDPKHFNYFLGKIWYDTCGMTNLGLYAYDRFFRSPLKEHFPLSAKAKTRLLGKCLIRRYKN